MATTITCGTVGRDHSTLQAAHDAIPDPPTGGYIVDCYPDTEFTAGLVVSGNTTTAANFITFRAATTFGAMDDRANTLHYDSAEGVAIVASPFSEAVIDIQDNHVTLERLQIKRTANSYNMPVVDFNAGLVNSKIKDCIVEKGHNQTGTAVNLRESFAINTIAIDTGGGTTTGFAMLNLAAGPGTCINCTAVRSSALAAGGTGFFGSATYTTSTVKNCASFNWTTDFSGGAVWTAASDFNASDGTGGPGANSVDSLTYADQFESTTADFRLKSGSGLIDTGSTDATNAPNDISGTARGLTTDGDIGCWEFAGAAAAVFPPDTGWMSTLGLA